MKTIAKIMEPELKRGVIGISNPVGQPWGDRAPRTQIVFIGSSGGVDGDWLSRQLNEQS